MAFGFLSKLKEGLARTTRALAGSLGRLAGLGKASQREALDKIAFGDAALFQGRTYEIKGVDHPMLPQRWILVDSITQMPR